jgi:hypothetical protein
MNPRTVCFCHPIVCIISASVAPFLRRSMATTWAVLLPGRDAAVGTLKRWLRLPEFLVEYRRVRWEVAEQGYARAQQNTGVAASVLLKLMADCATPASSRIRAALGIFDISREGLDLDMETRVSALERAVAETKKTSPDRR